MRAGRTPLRNGLLFGLVTAVSGGGLWAGLSIMVWSSSTEDEKSMPLLLALCGEIVICFFAGFLAGWFNAPGRRKASTPGAESSRAKRMLGAIGWFFYRILVGCFVGVIATFAYCFLVIAPCFILARHFLELDEIPRDDPEIIALAGSAIAAFYCGLSGGIFGALLVTRRSPSDRPAVGSRAIRSSFLAFLLGTLFGASLGWVRQEALYFFVLAASVPVGILSGILGGIWADIRQSRGVFPARRLAGAIGEIKIE